jgi:hypothetical protein
MKEVKCVILCFEKYRKEDFDSCLNIAKTLAFEIGIEPTLPIKRSFKKRQFNKNNNDEEIQSPEEFIRVNYFLEVVDMTIISLKNRFEQLKVFLDLYLIQKNWYHWIMMT